MLGYVQSRVSRADSNVASSAMMIAYSGLLLSLSDSGIEMEYGIMTPPVEQPARVLRWRIFLLPVPRRGASGERAD